MIGLAVALLLVVGAFSAVGWRVLPAAIVGLALGLRRRRR